MTLNDPPCLPLSLRPTLNYFSHIMQVEPETPRRKLPCSRSWSWKTVERKVQIHMWSSSRPQNRCLFIALLSSWTPTMFGCLFTLKLNCTLLLASVIILEIIHLHHWNLFNFSTLFSFSNFSVCYLWSQCSLSLSAKWLMVYKHMFKCAQDHAARFPFGGVTISIALGV